MFLTSLYHYFFGLSSKPAKINYKLLESSVSVSNSSPNIYVKDFSTSIIVKNS